MSVEAAVPGRALTPGETFIKICGITRLSDGLAAADAGASAIGFVFAPSPRRMEVAQAAAIRSRLPSELGVIGVFVDEGMDEVLCVSEAVGLDGIQLQGSESDEEVVAIRIRRPQLFVTRAIRLTGPADGARTAAIAADAVMVDSKDAHRPTEPHGPLPAEWLTGFRPERLIVAGRLGPDTVGSVVAAVRPWGVDVSSGVEQAPGNKDSALIRRFVAAVREAELASGGVVPA